MSIDVFNDYQKFADAEEEYINKIRGSVKEKADYNLRQIISITNRLNKEVDTGERNEFGDPIESWEQVSTKSLINYYSEGASWNYFSSPIKMQAFIESSLAEIVYNYNLSQELTDPNLTGTVAVKTAQAEINVINDKFVYDFKKLYTSYVTEVLKSFDIYLKRLEKVIEWRLYEERMNPNKSPFQK